jgi:predicted RNase H-like HicB family nuclease
MQRLTVEIIPDREEGGFTARVPDIPAYGEGLTEEEAIGDLREALRAYVEGVGVDDALATAEAAADLYSAPVRNCADYKSARRLQACPTCA